MFVAINNVIIGYLKDSDLNDNKFGRKLLVKL